jgi:hypothetical protein
VREHARRDEHDDEHDDAGIRWRIGVGLLISPANVAGAGSALGAVGAGGHGHDDVHLRCGSRSPPPT